jgi:hypothetical protein
MLLPILVVPASVNLIPVTPVMREAATCSKCGSSKREGGTCPGCGDEG